MLLSNVGAISGRPHLKHASSASSGAPQDLFSDARTHGYQGPTRHVRLPRVTGGGNAAIAKSGDEIRCAVAGRESLRILRISQPDASELGSTNEHKFAVGKGGFRIEASRNIWDGSGLHIDSANTDVAWCQGIYSNKILTSARNGELIMWDMNKTGPSKCERRIRDHTRSIHALAYSPLLEKYCLTASADGDLRVWDLRDLSRSQMWIRHPGPVRAVVFSPIAAHPLQAICGLDNGAIYRWDLNMGQRGQLDRLLAAHGGPILSLDWTVSTGSGASARTPQSNWYGASSTALGLLDEIIPSGPLQSGVSSGGGEMDGAGMGWLASGGLDRCVKVWDLTTPIAGAHISHDPTYTLRTAFPVRRVLWRPGYECELAIVSHTDQGVSSSVDLHAPGVTGGHLSPASTGPGSGLITALSSPRMPVATLAVAESAAERTQAAPMNDGGAPIEIWDVRRGFIAKWVVNDSVGEGNVRDIAFADSHAIWAQHSSGAFSQLDLRYCSKPLNAIPRTAVTWDPVGTLAFVTDQRKRWEVPYDDVQPEKRQVVQDWNGITKALGDPPFMPQAQSYGTVTLDAPESLETFIQLAQSYIYEGADRLSICTHNAKAAMDAGQIDAAQTWLTLHSLLDDIVPELPLIPLADSQSVVGPPLECASAPAAIPPPHTSPLSALPQRSMSIDRSSARGNDERSPSSLSREQMDSLSLSAQDRQSPRPETPVSSTTSSPRKPSTSLPHLQTSLYSRRGSSVGQGQAIRPKLSTSYRRPSSSFLSSPSIRSIHSDSPGDSARGTPSLKHVGEGALDDSDSSESEEDSALVIASRSDSGDEEAPLTHPVYTPLRPGIAVHPSPLAHQQVWTEDEGDNDEESPSPGSSSDSDGRGPPRRPKLKRSRTKSSARSQTRSRSSTVASLAVNASSTKLVRKASSASVRTVVACHAADQDDGGLPGPNATKPEKAVRPIHNRTRSTTFADEVKIGLSRVLAEDNVDGGGEPAECSVSVREAEARFRELGWSALREVVDDLADQGDVQMCALLSLVAAKELRISPTRTLRFVEAYISVLVRLRLHTAAAYLRKYIEAEDIRNATALQTTIYTCCTRCRKPIMLPATRLGPSGYPVGSYAYCTSCKAAVGRCSICHLPVRALAFTCPVCLHGGHQECYRNFYLRRPMVVISSGESAFDPEATAQPPLTPSFPSFNLPFLGTRGRSSSRTSSLIPDGNSEEGSRSRTDGSIKDPDIMHQPGHLIQGHACAAGCGHFCWAAQQNT